MSSGQRKGARLRRLSFRLTLWHSLVVFCSGLALFGITNVLLRERGYSTEKDAIEARAAQYASEYAANGLRGVKRLAAFRKGRAQKAFFVRVGDAKNHTLFLRDPDDWAEFAPAELSHLAIPLPGERSWHTLRSQSGTDLLIATIRMADGGVLQVGKSNEDVRALLSDFRRTGWWMILAFVPLSYAGGAFLAWRALRPVQDLTGVARSIIETNRFDARVPARGSGDELDALVHLFNEMLGRIDGLVRGMRDSLDNVAHDLRTPLMRLSQKAQNLIEANQTRPAAANCPNCAAAVEALGDCVEEGDRLNAMLNTLMDIAETEAGLVRLDLEPRPIGELLDEAREAYAEFAEERKLRITSDVPLGLTVKMDTAAMSRVFANLLDNAIKYTPPGGSVQIRAEACGQHAQIRITDTGVGIAPEDLPRIWERLFRSDRSRAERGLGLGLSFVRAIVEAHGGNVAATSVVGKGTEVVINLPLVSQSSPALVTV